MESIGELLLPASTHPAGILAEKQQLTSLVVRAQVQCKADPQVSGGAGLP